MSPTPEPNDDALELALRASLHLEDAPPWLIERTINAGPATAAPPRPALSDTLRRVLASLTFDSGTAPALALGLRAAGAGVRQLLFSLAGYDIDLRIAPASEGAAGWLLSGQLLGPDQPGEAVLSGDGGEMRVIFNEMSEFRFGPVAAGRWNLTLFAGDVQIELPTLELPAPGR